MKKRLKKNLFLLSIFVFVLTLSIRLMFIVETMNKPIFRTPTPGMDIDLHWQAARLLVEGAKTDEPYFELMMCSTPLHQYWHAFWQIVLGNSLVIHRILNALLAAASALLIFTLIAMLVGNRLIAFICALVWAGLPSLIYFDSTLHKSALEICALCILLHVVLSTHNIHKKFHYILKGLLIGLLLSALLLLQGNTFLYFIVILAYYGIDRHTSRKNRLVIIATVTFVFTTTMFTYSYRNKLSDCCKYPWFLPQKGIHFQIGFNEKADGKYHKLAYIPSWPYGHTFHARIYAEIESKKTLTPKEADRFFIDKSLEFIVHNPSKAFRLIITKALLFFNNYEVKGVDDLYYLRTQSKILSLTPFGLGIIVLFSGAGIIYLIQLKKYSILFLLTGLLAAILSSNIVGFVSWRYRLHNIIPLIIFASFGLASLQHAIIRLLDANTSLQSKVVRFTLTIILPLFICGWVTYRPVMEKQQEKLYRQASINAGLSKNAEKMIMRLEKLDLDKSTHNNPEKMILKALLLNKLHRHSESYRILEAIHKKQLYHPSATYKYLVYLMWLGEYEEAAQLLSDVKRSKPRLFPIIRNKLRGIEKKAYELFIKPHILNNDGN